MNPLKLIAYTAQHHPKKLGILPLRDALMDMARQNGKRPAYLKIAVHDDVVKNLKGDEERMDSYYLVLIPRDVAEEAKRGGPLVLEPGRLVLPR